MDNFWKLHAVNDHYSITSLSEGNFVSINDSSKYTPDGAYTTFRTYNRFYVLNLTKHFDRLEETARLAGKPVLLIRKEICKFLGEVIEKYPNNELRIRITVDLSVCLGDIYIVLETLITPEIKCYENGIDVITTTLHRSNPKAKLNKFLSQASEVRRQKGSEYEEILMVDSHNEILEGLSSNFYAVIRDEIFTAEEGVLFGTTRDYVLRLAKKLAIPVNLRPVSIHELKYLDEAFITSTSRSILPIRSIDNQKIDEKAPGPITKKLMQAFNEDINSALEDIRTIGLQGPA
ncbi:MAG TPA: aminotransferase class IV [Flexilinea sp.]|nr:aminotransferase class IV [Flexilinea sp.]